MSRKYKFGDHDRPHFITMTVVDWIDFFIRDPYRNVFVDSIKYCQENKGLVVYGYCMMTSHVHMIIARNGIKTLDEIVRDMKSFTSQTYHKLIGDTMQVHESRKNWMLSMMKSHHNRKGNTAYKFKVVQLKLL